MTDPFAELVARVRDAVLADVEPKLEALRRELLVARAQSRPLSVDEACSEPSRGHRGVFPFSRATLYRWLSDPTEGLEDGPEPVVTRPNGPGGKVLIHAERMQRWLDARNGRRRRRRRP